MNQRRHITLIAAAATVLGALPLSTVFERWTWLVDVILVVGLATGAALLVRSARTPVWAPTVAMAATFLLALTWIFHSGHELLGLIPTTATVAHWNDLLLSAGRDMRELGIPVEDRDGLLFLTTLGVGAVAVVVDLFAVVLRRPALAGLPLLAIYSVPVAVHDDSVSFLPFVLGAAGYLWLLVTDNVDRVRRFGRRFTGDGHDVDMWEPSPLAATGRRMAVIGVLLAVMLPLGVPGMTSGLLNRYGSGSGGTGGTGRGQSASVNLFAVLSASLTADRQVEMVRVSTNDPAPYYLRLAVADQLTSNGFGNQQPQGGTPVTGSLPEVTPQGPGVSQHSYRASVNIINMSMPLLPIYQQPTKIERLDSAWLYERNSQVLYSLRANSKSKKYGFDYVHVDYTPEALRTATALPLGSGIRARYTRAPTVTDLQTLVDSIVKGKTTMYDKVRAIYDYFSAANGFKYSLQTKPGSSGTAILDFLNNKEGFCEQYAAAMAWMVRAADIPARVAIGFTRGTLKDNETRSLTNYNLHAWTEVYFNGFGWVPFDPTPPGSIVGSVSPAWAPDPNRGSGPSAGRDEGDLKPGQVPNDDASAPAVDATGDPNAGGAGSGGGGGPASHWWLWTLLAALAALVVLVAPALQRAVLRRRRLPAARSGEPPGLAVADRSDPDGTAAPGEPRVVVTDETAAALARRDAHAAWDELVDTMVDFQIPIDQAETPRATAERLVRHAYLTEQPAAGARRLASAEERARYARRPLPADDLGRSLALIRRALIDRVSGRTRLRALLMPPSVVQRWRLASVTAATTFVNDVARWRDSVSRVANPRRLAFWRSSG